MDSILAKNNYPSKIIEDKLYGKLVRSHSLGTGMRIKHEDFYIDLIVSQIYSMSEAEIKLIYDNRKEETIRLEAGDTIRLLEKVDIQFLPIKSVFLWNHNRPKVRISYKGPLDYKFERIDKYPTS